MPEWLEKRSPKLGRMFEHIVDNCMDRDKGDWDLPSGVENCYEYAMGRVKDEPEFKKGKTMSMERSLAARRRNQVGQVVSGKQRMKTADLYNGDGAGVRSRYGTPSIKNADPTANALRIMSNLKKSLLRVEQEAKLAEQELEDLRYVAPPDSLQEAFEAVPRIMGAQEALQDALNHIRSASERVDAAKHEMRGAQGGNQIVEQAIEQRNDQTKKNYSQRTRRLRLNFYQE